MRQDLAYAGRALWRAKGFAVTAILTLALGIGANTAIFTLVRAVLLKPLPFPEPEQLMRVSGGATDDRFTRLRGAASFAGAAAYTVFGDNLAWTAPEGPEPMKGARVSANFLAVLGASPLLGRSFLADEEQLGPRVVMLSAELWRSRFAADPAVLGRTLTLSAGTRGAETYTVVGVLPPDLKLGLDADLLRPWQPDDLPLPVRQNSPLLSVFARLRPGVSRVQANAEVAVLHRQYATEHKGALDARPEAITPLQESLVRGVAPLLWLLLSAVALLLLLACANVAGLMVARATSRASEFAVRAALGAGRGRLLAAQLAESLWLAVAGGVLGVLVAWLSLGWLVTLPGLDLPHSRDITLDGQVLAFALALTLLSTLLFGLGPAWGASRPEVARMMRTPDSQGWVGRFRLGTRGGLLIGQIALSVVLLLSALLMIVSMARLKQVSPGFEPRKLLTMQITLPEARHEELVRRVEAIPGVRSAAMTLTLPMTGFAGTPVQAAEQPLRKLNERTIAVLQTITPGYFRTLQIPLRQGRDFTRNDSSSAPLVAILSESLARRFWPEDPAPVGRQILVGTNPKPLTVVGIAADIHQAGLGEAMRPGLYRPRSQMPEMPAMFAVRATGDPAGYVSAIRRELAALDRHQAIGAVRPMEEVIGASEGQRGSLMLCLTLFAGAGLILVSVGIYGVMAYSVTRRMRELGIRRALGARPGDLLRLLLGQGLSLAAAGVLLGLVGAFWLTRLLKGQLYGIAPTDPVAYAAVAVVMLLVALAASYFPARRALGNAGIRGIL
ncbi:MAG: ABC transporter permease [Bryobacteraceae bacterium]|nr:ABC transporter permease [Bryobacteraceae bacterium]